MTSERKIAANRANARASTGPKTAHGRARASRNALQYALSVPVNLDPKLAEEIEALARKIAGADPIPEIRARARRVAEAQIDLRRVRSARHQLLSQPLSDPEYDSDGSVREKMALVLHNARIAPLTPMPDDMVKRLTSKPEGPLELAIILADKSRRLLAMDRYERRALSRRKFAIRVLDEALAAAHRVTNAMEGNTVANATNS